MTKQFSTPKRQRRTIEFDLDDDRYHFTPSKIAGVMLTMVDGGGREDPETRGVSMTQASWDWLREGLPHEPVEDVVEVREDGDDRATSFPTFRDAADVWGEENVYSPEYQRIRARLDDPHDDLDFGDVASVVRWLIGQATGRPTGKRRA